MHELSAGGMALYVIFLRTVAGLFLEEVEHRLHGAVDPLLLGIQLLAFTGLEDIAELILVLVVETALELGRKNDETIPFREFHPADDGVESAALSTVKGEEYLHLADITLRGNIIIEGDGLVGQWLVLEYEGIEASVEFAQALGLEAAQAAEQDCGNE